MMRNVATLENKPAELANEINAHTCFYCWVWRIDCADSH